MAKPKQAQGYDVLGTAYRQEEDPRASLEQVFRDYVTSIPYRNFSHRTLGEHVTIYLHAHERGLGDVGRRALQVHAMEKAMDAFVKGLKKRHREMGAGNIDLKEVKPGRGYDLQKTSLNDRWDIVYRRTYRVEDLIGTPED